MTSVKMAKYTVHQERIWPGDRATQSHLGPMSLVCAGRPLAKPREAALSSAPPRASLVHPWVSVCPKAATPSWRLNQHEQDPVRGCPLPSRPHESNQQRCAECREPAICWIWLGAGWAGQERAIVQELSRYLTSTYLCWAFGITK